MRRSPPRGPWLASGRRHPSVLQKRCGWRRAFDHRVIHNWRLCSSPLDSSGSLFLAAKEGIPSASMALPDVSHSIMARIIGRWFVCTVASRASRVPIGPGTTRPHGSPGTMYPFSPIDQIEIQPARTWATCQKCRLRLSDTSKHSKRGVSSRRSIHMVSSRSGGSMEDCWNKATKNITDNLKNVLRELLTEMATAQ